MTLYDTLPKPIYKALHKVYMFTVLPIVKAYSNLAFRLSKVYGNNQMTLHELHNIHQGQRAFIIGNGPSLTAGDLGKIDRNKDISFASNHIWQIFDKSQWRPTYYASVNDGIPNSRSMEMIGKAEAKYKFLRSTCYLFTKSVSGSKLFINVHGKGTMKKPKFAEDVSEVVYAMGTTTFVLIELAVYMGCKELYIIGCDNQYSITQTEDGKIIHNDSKSYFDAADKTARQVPIETWQMTKAYEFAKQYAEAHGIKIYNAGRGGYLETFERVDFDSLF